MNEFNFKKDTRDEFADKIQKLYLELTPVQRFDKMFSLCQTVREIMKSQLPSDLSKKEKEKFLFINYYKNEFSSEEFQKILEKLF